MNVVREINKINDQELQLGVKGSWHDEYKDSAYVFVGGLSYDLTEGDVITIMSQFGEVIDINMPRDKETGKPKGFSFLMYEDQRSTVLAVDNMNGAQVLGRTIRVDHCKRYEQKGTKNAEGDYVAPEEPTYNAMPPTLDGSSDESFSDSEADELDEEDPMAAYLRQQKKAKKITDGKKRKHDGGGESKEDRRARKDEKRRRKEERDRKRKEREGKKRKAPAEAESSGGRVRGPQPIRRRSDSSGEPSGSRARPSALAQRSEQGRDRNERARRDDSPPRRSRDPDGDRYASEQRSRDSPRDTDRRRDRSRDHGRPNDNDRDRDRRRDYSPRRERNAGRYDEDRNGRYPREADDGDRRYRR